MYSIDYLFSVSKTKDLMYLIKKSNEIQYACCEKRVL